MADVKKICSSSFGNLGSGCDAQNGMLAITGIILAVDGYSMSYQNASTKSDWESDIKAKQLFPLMGAMEYDDNTEETKNYESPLGVKIKLRNGKYGYTFRFNLSITQHRELQKFSSANLGYYLVDAGGTIYGYSDDDANFKPFSLASFDAEKMTRATADQPAWSPVTVTEANSVQWNSYGITITPDWVAEDLVGLANVNITIVGTPTATSLNVFVGSPTGKLDSDGVVEVVPISGITPTDFVVVKASDGSLQTVTFVDSGDGNYVGTGSSLVTGTVDLLDPSSMHSTGLLIESTGSVSFTI